MNNCYTINTFTNALIPKQNMNYSRGLHGVQKMAQKIFAFGGENPDGQQFLKSSEVYDVVQNSWKNLPDMLDDGTQIT